MIRILLFTILVLSSLVSQASNLSYMEVQNLGLPVVVITTVDAEEPTCEYVTHPEGSWGESITNATKVPGSVSVIATNGETIYDSGEYEKGESGITIKIRGNTSAYKDKKPYKIKLQKKGDLLGRGDKNFNDKNWVLLGDNSLRLWVGFELSRLVEEDWSPAGMYVNVIMNGDYRGIYYLCEAVERNEKCRINVSDDGFIMEHDAYWWNEDGQFIPSMFRPHFGFTFKYPDYEDIDEETIQKITEILELYEQSMVDGTYENVIDLPSFAKWILSHDILGSWDSAGSNLYLSKYDMGSSSLIKAGPLWDFDSIYRMDGQWSSLHYADNRFRYFYPSVTSPFMTSYRELWKDKSEEIFAGINEMIEDFRDDEKWAPYDLSCVEDKIRWKYQWDANTAKEAAQDAEEWFSRRYIWLNAMFESFEHEEAGIESLPDSQNYPVNIYSISGVIIKQNCSLDYIKSLPKGIYIISIGNKKYKISI